MTYINKNGFVKALEVGGARVFGFVIIIYSVLFISVFGGIIELGKFSAVGAILAPLTMFVTFRYIELIGVSKNREKTFTDLITSAFFVYAPFSVIIGAWIAYYGSNDIRLHDYALMAIYKFIELFGDVLAVVLIQSERGMVATKIALYKMSSVVVLSGVLYFVFGVHALNSVYISFVIGFAAVFILVEMPLCKKHGVMSFTGLADVCKFIQSHYGLGFFNSLMSLNSVMPRYYILYFGDLRILGIFSLIYQISSVSVNFIEYAAGIYVKKTSEMFVAKPFIVKLIYLSCVASFLFVLIGSMLGNNYWLFRFLMFVIAMFVVLFWRGISVVVCLGLGVNINYAVIMIISMVVGCVSIGVLEYFSASINSLLFAVFYVLVASSVFGFILFNKANREILGG